MRNNIKWFGYAFIAFFWSILLFLFALLVMHFYTLSYGPSLPGRAPWDFTAKYYYLNYGRNILQSTPDCVAFDSLILYKPKDGSCDFNNIEFKTVITNKDSARVNPYLKGPPSMLILGDSYAQGWGVNDDQTVASILTKKYNVPTLSLGMSSYGTAREIEALRRYIEQSNNRPRVVLIMYCSNDWRENFAYLENGFVKKTNAEYDVLFEFKGSPSFMIKSYENVGFNVVSLKNGLSDWIQTIPFGEEYPYIHGPNKSISIEDQVYVFKSILNKNILLFKDTTIIVSGFYGWGGQDKFSKHLLKDPYLKDGSKLEVLVNNLPPNSYYPFDGHLNAVGNEDFARDVASVIRAIH